MLDTEVKESEIKNEEDTPIDTDPNPLGQKSKAETLSFEDFKRLDPTLIEQGTRIIGIFKFPSKTLLVSVSKKDSQDEPIEEQLVSISDFNGEGRFKGREPKGELSKYFWEQLKYYVGQGYSYNT